MSDGAANAKVLTKRCRHKSLTLVEDCRRDDSPDSVDNQFNGENIVSDDHINASGKYSEKVLDINNNTSIAGRQDSAERQGRHIASGVMKRPGRPEPDAETGYPFLGLVTKYVEREVQYTRVGLRLENSNMAALKDKLTKAVDKVDPTTSHTPENDNTTATTPKYVLKVSAGPSYDKSTHTPVQVNSPKAISFANDFVDVRLKVRIRDYDRLPKGSRNSTPYFDDPLHEKDQYSIGFTFVPKVDLPAKDIIWGNDFDHPIRDRLPPGFNTAFKIVKDFIDPGLMCDAYADEPWLYGPALSCWFLFRIGEQLTSDSKNLPQPEEDNVLKEGADGSGVHVREQIGMPETAEKRRKYFLSEENRAKMAFEKGRIYHGDFFNPYLDFNRFALRLPGFSLSVLKYINDKSHTLRYVCKNGKTGDVYFVVVMTLLFGQELKDAFEPENMTQSIDDADADSETTRTEDSIN
ncbi:MAG: hypothetical protein M1831_001987 [Alyxoria varia]|nr:MAG: hypothetical protein M1831_001987 [Alyxoria varia]